MSKVNKINWSVPTKSNPYPFEDDTYFLAFLKQEYAENKYEYEFMVLTEDCVRFDEKANKLLCNENGVYAQQIVTHVARIQEPSKWELENA